jgi:hypothetical protein
MTKPKIGDIIPFGEYKWRVLDVQEDMALIITEDIVERRAYHKEYTEITWEMSDLREYLNGEFLSTLDSSKIALTTNINPNNQWFGTSGGNNTQDKIFLLSLEELCSSPYFGDSKANLQKKNSTGTDYYFSDSNNAKRIAKYGNITFWWWLRSSGNNSYSAASVIRGGSVRVCGLGVNFSNGGVRPALWLKLSNQQGEKE